MHNIVLVLWVCILSANAEDLKLVILHSVWSIVYGLWYTSGSFCDV